jgi:hypothetical protein
MLEWNQIDYKHEIRKVSLFNRIRYSDFVGDIRYYVRLTLHNLFGWF